MDPVLARRTIRKYTRQPVGDEKIQSVLEAAMAAPSAGDERPWHFVVIRDRGTLDAIPDFHAHANMMKDAPVALLVCADLSLVKYEGFWVQDCAAATQNILIQATTEGLGSAWLGVCPREERMAKVRELLELPENVVPFALVALGHPAERKPPAKRYNELRVHYDKW